MAEGNSRQWQTCFFRHLNKKTKNVFAFFTISPYPESIKQQLTIRSNAGKSSSKRIWIPHSRFNILLPLKGFCCEASTPATQTSLNRLVAFELRWGAADESADVSVTRGGLTDTFLWERASLFTITKFPPNCAYARQG